MAEASLLVKIQNGGTQAAEGNGEGSVPNPPPQPTETFGQVVKSLPKSIGKGIKGVPKSLAGAVSQGAKTAGVTFTLAALLKQSQVFTSYMGSVFQIFGALIDVTLAPLIPIFIPVLKFLGKMMPGAAAMGKIAADGIISIINYFRNNKYMKAIGAWWKTTMPDWAQLSTDKIAYAAGMVFAAIILARFTGVWKFAKWFTKIFRINALLTKLFPILKSALKALVTKPFGWIKTAVFWVAKKLYRLTRLDKLVTMLKSWFGSIAKSVGTKFLQLFNLIKGGIGNVVNPIIKAFTSLFKMSIGLMRRIAASLLKLPINLLKGLTNLLGKVISGLWNGIKTLPMKLIKGLGFIKEGLIKLRTHIGKLVGGITKLFSIATKAITTKLSNLFKSFSKFVPTIKTGIAKVQGFVGKLVGNLQKGFGIIITKLRATITTLPSKITKGFGTWITKLKADITTFGTKLVKNLNTTLLKVWSGVKTLPTKIIKSLNNVGAIIKTGFSGLWTKIKVIPMKMISGFAAMFAKLGKATWAFIKGLPSSMLSGLKALLKSILAKPLELLGAGLKRFGIKGVGEAIGKIFKGPAAKMVGRVGGTTGLKAAGMSVPGVGALIGAAAGAYQTQRLVREHGFSAKTVGAGLAYTAVNVGAGLAGGPAGIAAAIGSEVALQQFENRVLKVEVSGPDEAAKVSMKTKAGKDQAIDFSYMANDYQPGFE